MCLCINQSWHCFGPCDISLGVKDVTLSIPCQSYLGAPNMRFSSPYVTCPVQSGVQADLLLHPVYFLPVNWTWCAIFVLFSLSPGVLKRISYYWICKLTGMDVRTRLLVTPSCLRAPLESPQLPPQRLIPCPARPPSWRSTAPLRVSHAYVLFFIFLIWWICMFVKNRVCFLYYFNCTYTLILKNTVRI